MQSPSSGQQTRQQTLSWPQTLAFVAAILFTLSSATLNVLYGFAKGSDAITAIVWCAVAVAASIIFALSWPALIRSLEAHRWAAAMAALVALLLAGSYSVSAALGSAAGGRANAAIEEKDVTDKRAKAQGSYDAAKVELGLLKPTRTVGELQAMRDGWKRAYRSEPWVLEPELARAKRRAELEAKMERAAGELKNTGPAKVANIDAVALAAYLSALGIETDAERMNKLLVLLAVLVIECGGGLSLAVGFSLAQMGRETASVVALSGAGPHQDTATQPQSSSGHAEHAPDTPASGRTQSNRTTGHVAPDTLLKAMPMAGQRRPDTPDTSASGTPDTTDRNAAGVRFLAFLQERGGVLVSGQREIGRAMGWSKSWTNEVLHDLAAAELVKLSTGKSGTVVKLLPVACKVRAVA